MGGYSSLVAAIGLEQNSENKGVVLVDESSGEALVMESSLIGQDSSVWPTLVCHDEVVPSCVVGAKSQSVGKKKKKIKEKK